MFGQAMVRYLIVLLTLLPGILRAQPECDVTLAVTPVSCTGLTDGAIAVITNSGGPFLYSLNGSLPPVNVGTWVDLAPGPYSVVITDTAQATQCISVIDTVVIEPTLIITGNPVYCPSDPPVLTVEPSIGYNGLFYAWSSGDTAQVIDLPPGTNGPFTVTSIDAAGCELQADVEVEELPSPTAVMGIPDTACQNVLVQVLTLATTGDSIVWRWQGNGFSNAFNELVVFTEGGYQPISIQAFNSIDACGSLPVQDSIYIEAQVPAIFSAAQIPCTTELDILLGSVADSCAFFVNDSLYVNDCNGFIRYDIKRYDLHTLTLYATQANGCNDTLEVILDVRTEPTLFLSNAFSPDGDGINEAWPARVDVPALGYEVVVYDRWGRQLWISNDPFGQWDGLFNGSPVPVGVYAYTMRHRDPCQATDEIRSSGHVTVVR
jgi:gliding motility-associated-like protein